jgi:hypothetical protein
MRAAASPDSANDSEKPYPPRAKVAAQSSAPAALQATKRRTARPDAPAMNGDGSDHSGEARQQHGLAAVPSVEPIDTRQPLRAELHPRPVTLEERAAEAAAEQEADQVAGRRR